MQRPLGARHAGVYSNRRRRWTISSRCRRQVAFSEASCRFLEPVFAGDTVYPCLGVVELTPQRSTGVLTMKATVHNQERVLVMEGEHKYIIKKRN